LVAVLSPILHPLFARETRATTAVEWAAGVEILVNPYSLADLADVKISASLLCNVGIRYPSAFGFGPLS
jgi:hypothetical protein